MKKLSLTVLSALIVIASSAQDSTTHNSGKNDKKDARRQKTNNLIKQSEEGILVYSKQSIFGVQGRTNGYGIFYELGRMKTVRKTNIYRIDITEIKNSKEDKSPNAGIFFGNPYIYGKVNSFYPVTLGVGQQYILGQKGNKNGVAISAVYNAGIALGLLRPYYLEVQDPMSGNNKLIKYSTADRDLFLGPTIVGAGGFGKGWSELKVKPGAFAKTALRFDYGRFNEVVSGIEVGLSVEFYGSKIPIVIDQKDKQMFFQGYIALLFGRRK
ncbi:MAG: hypothetical protein ABJA85_02610 [Bacteroidota bacterium]